MYVYISHSICILCMCIYLIVNCDTWGMDASIPSLDVILGNRSDGYKCHYRFIHQGDPVETSTMASNNHF